MAPRFNNDSDKQIRIMSALCYMSGGVIGLIYILLNGKNNNSQFFRFHFIQAILIAIFAMLIGWAGSSLSQFTGGVLGLFGGMAAGAGAMIGFGIGLVIQLAVVVLMIADIWGVIQSLRGKFANIPVFSKIVRNNLRY